MGASKTKQYSTSELYSANLALALSHPARIRILKLLQTHNSIRNIDLVSELELAKSSVHVHLTKLMKVNLISLEFHSNSYLVVPNYNELEKLPSIFESFSN